MYVKHILWILLVTFVREVSLEEHEEYDGEVYYDEQPQNCSTTEGIKGGNVSYSQGGLEGSVLTYHCGPGRYPFPVSHRLCREDGEWSPMRLANGRPTSRATCKDVSCPAQLQLDHGDLWPRDQWLGVGATQSFSCQEGFTLYGSAQRNCTLSGEWTGSTPVCDNHADDCSDPGVPAGALRSAGRFQTGEKVSYRCQAGLDLLGSDERVCLENREWSGTAPRCQGPNTFDSPSFVAEAMAGSLAGLMDVFSPDSIKKARLSYGRTIRVEEGSRMNVYILLDTSGSIQKQAFEKARDATIALINKLGSYEVQLKFHVLSFASEAKDIVNITDLDRSGNTDEVINSLLEFDYHSHGKKTGTNLYAALLRVYKVMSFLKANARSNFDQTQHVIVVETDGFANTGGDPQTALNKIKSLLGYDRASTDETMLDVYVFGIGEEVNKPLLNSLASMKNAEKHVFVLKSYATLGVVFNSIISDKSVTMCGIAQEEDSKRLKETYNKPWHVAVEGRMTCVGSIVSQNWVLTAAHCFADASTDQVHKLGYIKLDKGTVVSKKVIMHPGYNTRALKGRNVSEVYDYDVALVQVNHSIPLSWKNRPICLPCTVPASRAMKKVNSTCQQHREELLPHEQTAAFFIHKGSHRKETHIHTGSQRPGCVEKAMLTLKEPTNVTLDEYVSERFLCTGGSAGYRDPITCKGDSGGSLFLRQRNRYFQVGVVSWGTVDVCRSPDPAVTPDRPHPDARDFHIDLFKIMPWLKQHLGEDIRFLPDVQ